jgi:GGDEF domain-containing protein
VSTAWPATLWIAVTATPRSATSSFSILARYHIPRATARRACPARSPLAGRSAPRCHSSRPGRRLSRVDRANAVPYTFRHGIRREQARSGASRRTCRARHGGAHRCCPREQIGSPSSGPRSSRSTSSSRINDRFGYQNADELLKSLGRLLKDFSKSFPGNPDGVQVFHPHGDEFFVVGTHDGPDPHRPDALSTLLDLACAKVRELSLTVERPPKAPETLSCTVSIGWLVSSDVAAPRTARAIRDCLERAVDEAKRTRNCAVRYSSALRHRQSVSLRADCESCRSKFTVDILVEANRPDDPLHCPNCGKQIERPPAPDQAVLTLPVEI